MTAFRAFLALVLLTVGTYTGLVIARHGLNLFPVFFGDMGELTWRGQFNLDFMCVLAFSGLWVAYRHRFSAVGLVLGLGAFFGGAPFLSAYLLVHAVRTKGDMAALLLGDQRASA